MDAFPENETTMADVIRDLVRETPFVAFTISLGRHTRLRVERPDQISSKGTLIVHRSEAGGESWFSSCSVVSVTVESPWVLPAPDAIVGPKE